MSIFVNSSTSASEWSSKPNKSPTNQDMSNPNLGIKLFANKSDLLKAEKRVAELEAELRALKQSPLAAETSKIIQRNRELEAKIAALSVKPLSREGIAQAAAKSKPQTEREQIRAEYDQITDPVRKRAFRMANWSILFSGKKNQNIR